MSRVCFFVGNIDLAGGTERVTSSIANALQDSGLKVTVLSLWGQGKPFFDLHPDIRLERLFSRRIPFSALFWLAAIKLKWFLLRNEYDYLIDTDAMLSLASAPALAGSNAKHVCWEHFGYHISYGWALRSFARRMVIRFADKIVTVTDRDRTLWLVHGASSEKTVTIPNPLSFAFPEHVPTQAAREVLAVGRLAPEKGFDLLLQAWAIARPELPGWHLKIVGEGKEQANLMALVARLRLTKTVRFFPFSKDVHQHYRSAALYCLSSRFEGFGMVLLEAFAYGVPAVSFACETGPITLVGDGGMLVEPENVVALAASIVHLAYTPDYPRYSTAARQIASQYGLPDVIALWQRAVLQ